MNSDIKLKIEAYLGDNLSPEEVILFEEQISNDEMLRKEVMLSKRINHHFREDFMETDIPDNEYTRVLKAYLNSEDAALIKKKLLKVQNEYREESKSIKKKNYFLAAAFLILFMLGTVGFLFLNQNTSDQLFAEYYATTDLPSLIKRGDTQDNLSKAVVLFQNGDFKNAISLFETYKNESLSVDPSVFIYEGVAFLNLENYEIAISKFDKMIASNSLDRSKGLWFKALVYLKMKDIKSTKLILNEIVKNNSNFNFKKAKDLLEEL